MSFFSIACVYKSTAPTQSCCANALLPLVLSAVAASTSEAMAMLCRCGKRKVKFDLVSRGRAVRHIHSDLFFLLWIFKQELNYPLDSGFRPVSEDDLGKRLELEKA